jgi:uncharacterized membrane protein YidH (DUF202 family)
MSENSTVSDQKVNLAKERSREAADRTLMAWIRTALSMIGFGFGIAKFYDYLEMAELRQALDPIHSTLLIGGGFIALGVFGLGAAVVQHLRILRRLAQENFAYTHTRQLPTIMAGMLLIIGVLALVALWI